MAFQDNSRYEKIGYCGLYCTACSFSINTQENDLEKLQATAARFQKPMEEVRCSGCRSPKTVFFYCRQCELKACARVKKIGFCSECSEYPCAKLKTFQAQMPHRAELFESLAYGKTHTVDEWEAKLKQDFSCPSCGTINTAYSLECRKCHTKPGNPFAERNMERIQSYFKANQSSILR